MRVGSGVLVASCVAALLIVAMPRPAAAQQEYDIYIRDNPTDDGSVSQPSGGTSPDIWIRLDGDCGQAVHQSPVRGADATVCVRVTNRMTSTVQTVTANVYWAQGGVPTTWPGSWTAIGSPVIASIAGTSSAVTSTAWSVPVLANIAVLVRLEAPDDPLATGPDTVTPVDIEVNNNNIASLQLASAAPPIPALERTGFALVLALLAISGVAALRRSTLG